MKLTLAAIAFLFVTSVGYGEDTKNEPLLEQSQTSFTLKLLGELSRGKNLIVSPLSIHELLAMVYLGTRGKTAFEIERVLELEVLKGKVHTAYSTARPNSEKAESLYTLRRANSLWVQKEFPILSEYSNTLKTHYGSQFRALDFKKKAKEARDQINQWAEKETDGKVKNLVGPQTVDKKTRLVLTNAVYFKSNWQQPFEKKLTKKGAFFWSPKRTIPASFMDITKEVNFYDGEEGQAFSLPYKGGQLAMHLFLPKGHSDWEKQLDSPKLREIKGKMSYERIHLKLPKFKFSTEHHLATTLKDLGMPTAFSKEADFSAMTLEKGLALGEVIQKAFVAVDEAGTEAAAASAAVMYEMGMPMGEAKEVIVNRPFFFIIEDVEKSIPLFAGKVVRPAY